MVSFFLFQQLVSLFFFERLLLIFPARRPTGRRDAALEHLFRLQVGRQSHQLRGHIPLVGPRHLVGTRVFGADAIDRQQSDERRDLGRRTQFKVR